MYRSKKGFTLVEVILTLAIISILFAVIASFIPLANTYKDTAVDIARAQNLAQQIFMEIEGQLRYATSLNILDEMPETFDAGTSYIYTSNGEILSIKNGESETSLTPSNGSGEYSYNINFIHIDFHMLQMTLTIKKKGKIIYNADSTINIQNLGNIPITGAASGNHVEYMSPAEKSVMVSLMVINGAGNISDGKPIKLTAEIYPHNATNKKIAWFVNDPKLARISDTGVLTPLKNGVVTVTAVSTDGSNISATKQIVISNMKTLVESLSLRTETNQNTLRINGNTLRIIADILPAEAENKSLVWSVDNTDYATISSDGVLTSKGIPDKSVVVTATTTDGSEITATIEILLIN
ncbi:MAG: Ig-like domain-containing protein [Acutalibacteraceae bacterium]|jgi:prepilin-type N-terminal cleavage/methylation domain-containing protein